MKTTIMIMIINKMLTKKQMPKVNAENTKINKKQMTIMLQKTKVQNKKYFFSHLNFFCDFLIW